MPTEPKRVYVLGAGASAASPYFLPTLKGLLWHVCRAVTPGQRKLVTSAIYEACGVVSKRKADSPDLEEFLNRLNTESLRYICDKLPSSSLRKKASDITLKALRKFIRAKCLGVATKKGPYDRLVHALGPRDIVISFNWDVLFEVALRRAGKRYTYLRTPRSGDATLILKPHGCISWFALLDRELLMIDLSANVAVLGDDLNYYMLYLKDPLGAPQMGKSNVFAKLALSGIPAIIPPAAPMTLSVGGPPRDEFVGQGHLMAMQAVWSAFRSAIHTADEVIAIGYSLPGTDVASIEVLKQFGMLRRSVGKRLLIVNRDSRVVDRYRKLVSPGARLLCDDFRKFNPALL